MPLALALALTPMPISTFALFLCIVGVVYSVGRGGKSRWWIVFYLLFICLGAFCVLAGRSERSAYMKQQIYMLKIAAEDFAKYGYVTNVWSNDERFWLSSNVVTIAGTRYQCYAEVAGGQFGEDGALAVTTNKVFIWLGGNQSPKIIDADYKPPLSGF